MTYSDSTSVLAFSREFLDGQTTFNSTTRPTRTEVTAFLTRLSNSLDLALAGEGLTTPITNTTAKSVCNDWVTNRSCEYVQMTHRGAGFSDAEGNRAPGFRNMAKSAAEFAKVNRMGFVRLGVTVTYGKSAGLAFTGMDVPADRTDPDDSSIVQPTFRRGLFDDPQATAVNNPDGDE